MTMQGWQEFPKYMTHGDLPPVVAQSADEEKSFRAEGYMSTKGDPEAFARFQSGAIPGYEPQPYPKMIGDRIVYSHAEEDEIRPPGPVVEESEPAADELAEFRAWKAAATPALARKTEAEELAELEAAERAAKPKHSVKVK
jgi:hypothetical protein